MIKNKAAYVIKTPFGYVKISDDNIYYFTDIKMATLFSEDAAEYAETYFNNRICPYCSKVPFGNF